MGPEGLVAYEYVGDGYFSEPCMGLRPWLSVSVWEYGLMQRLGPKSLRQYKNAADCACSTKIALWGLGLCAASDTISSPPDKIRRAQEFLTQDCFGPGVTRIPIIACQELRGNAELWGYPQ